MKKNIIFSMLVIAVMFLGVSASFAKKYSDAPSGQGTSTIGTGGDYTTLYDASVDFDATANTGSWTMNILNDLNEGQSVYFGNTVLSGSTITLKPAASTNPTITFSSTADNAIGWTGDLIIGANYSNLVNIDLNIKTDNFIIDGSNNGTNSQNLTLISSSTQNFVNRIITVAGACNNIVIKNCKIENKSTSAAASPAAISFTSRQTTNAVVSLVPSNGKISNCYIVCTASAFGEGFRTTFSTFSSLLYPVGAAQTGLIIENCTIEARHRALFFNNSAGFIVRNNTLRTRQTLSGANSYGIIFNTDNGATGWTGEVYNNKIDRLQTANTSLTAGQGINAMTLSGTSAVTYKVYNNMISGYNLTGGITASTTNYRGIIVAGASNIAYVYNNSIFMPNFSNYTNLQANLAQGMAISCTTQFVKNNIIYQGQAGAACISLSGTDSTTQINSNNNCLYADASSFVGRWFGTNIATLANWTATTLQDVNSESVNPFATLPGFWNSSTDLHFSTSSAAPLTRGVYISTPVNINFDIDNQIRDTTAPWKGADEAYLVLSALPNTVIAQPSNSVPITLSGGIAPYTWAIVGVGSLSTTGGSSNTFLAGLTLGNATITVTDSLGNTLSIPASVVPTYAPMVNDITMVPADRKDVIRFDLFE